MSRNCLRPLHNTRFQAIFIKTITTPSRNAEANLFLKVTDLILKFILAPHSSKSAYFDDILAQALNVLQVGVLYKFVKDKAEGLARSQGLGGNSAGTFFVAGALAAIIPLLFTAWYECVLKLLVLRRKMRLLQAKVQDAQKAVAKPSKEVLTRALTKAMKSSNANVISEFGAAPNSIARVELTEDEIQTYSMILAELLTTQVKVTGYDGKVILKAANEIKVQYLMSSNKNPERNKNGQGDASSDDTIIEIECLLAAVKTVMNNGSYKDALEKGGKKYLFQLLSIRENDLNRVRIENGVCNPEDLKAVARGLNWRDVENISRFRKLMQLCNEFEKTETRLRKVKLVLFELPWPKDYWNEALKEYVMGVKPKAKQVLSVRFSHESETSKHLCV